MPHPFKEIRVDAQPRLSVNRLAELTDLTRWAIIRTEQGLYSAPLDSILVVLGEASGKTSQELIASYTRWQKWKRRQSSADVLRALHYFAAKDWNVIGPPFVKFCAVAFPDESQIGRAKKLCVHPYTLRRYETEIQEAMPEQIVVALGDAGLSVEEIKKLEALGSIYYNDR